MCRYVSNIERFLRYPNYLYNYRYCDKVPNLSQKPLVFSLPNRLPNNCINHHKPTTLCYHIDGYVVAYIHSPTQWYQHIFLEIFHSYRIFTFKYNYTHTFVEFYSLDCIYYSTCEMSGIIKEASIQLQ